MVGGNEIDKLQLRKRALVLESSLNRLTLAAQWQNLHTATAWVEPAAQTFRQVRPWLLLLAPLAGLLVARNSPRPAGLLRRLLSVVKWARALWGAWESLSGTLAERRSQAPAQSGGGS